MFLVHFFGFFRGYDDFVQFRTKSTEYFYSLGKKSKKNWLFLKNPRKKPISRLYAPKMCWNCTESNVFGAFLPWLLGEYADFIQLSGKIRVFCRQIMGKNQKSRNFRYPKFLVGRFNRGNPSRNLDASFQQHRQKLQLFPSYQLSPPCPAKYIYLPEFFTVPDCARYFYIF